jgi:hypothetical protein
MTYRYTAARCAVVAVFGTLLVLTTAMAAPNQDPAYAPEDPAQTAARAATHKPAPQPALEATINFQAPSSASICYTCGGDWPIYSGTIPTPSDASERGSGCANPISTSLHDRTPYLCTR